VDLKSLTSCELFIPGHINTILIAINSDTTLIDALEMKHNLVRAPIYFPYVQ